MISPTDVVVHDLSFARVSVACSSIPEENERVQAVYQHLLFCSIVRTTSHTKTDPQESLYGSVDDRISND